jgi:hypothetical protein
MNGKPCSILGNRLELNKTVRALLVYSTQGHVVGYRYGLVIDQKCDLLNGSKQFSAVNLFSL